MVGIRHRQAKHGLWLLEVPDKTPANDHPGPGPATATRSCFSPRVFASQTVSHAAVVVVTPSGRKVRRDASDSPL